MSAATPGSPRDSGDTSGSRQTLVTGEATRRACEKLNAALEGKTLGDLVGQEFYGEYLAKTDPWARTCPTPVSHVAYGYAHPDVRSGQENRPH